jgi:SAM-dependent methyltransferase
MKITRTHDLLYLDENRYENTKESFKFLIGVIAQSFEINRDNVVISDFGCAAGELLYYLKACAPDASLEGYDLLPELVEKAKKIVPEVKFTVGSVLDNGMIENNHSDVSLLVGVHSIFDEFETCFNNLIAWTRPAGRVYVFGMFNPYPLDVFVKYRPTENYGSDTVESGWNIFSEASVSRFLDNHKKVAKHKFIPFEIPIDLSKHQDDPARSWTIKDEKGGRIITNGLCLLQPHQILEIVLR